MTVNQIISNQERQGFYTVGSTVFVHKISALIEATRTNQMPTWHFHYNTYKKLPWQQEYHEPLTMVYQRRAKQLRDKYDHLTLCFSGGSDSWTALKAFLDSRTHLDELYVRWPLAATKGRYVVSSVNVDPSNILSEWDLTVLPMLKQIKLEMPKTKITIYDWSEDLYNNEVDDLDWYCYEDFLNPAYKYKIPQVTNNQKSMIDQGKTCGIIFGVDKPQMFYKEGQVYCYFLDKLANRRIPNDGYRTSELFYWTPDMPEIVLAQSRAIMNLLSNQPQLLGLIDKSQPFDYKRKYRWDQAVRPVIYQEYTNLNTFQASKPTTSVREEIDSWMLGLENERFYQSWDSGIRNIIASVAPKFLEYRDKEFTGFLGFIDGPYNLGAVKIKTN